MYYFPMSTPAPKIQNIQRGCMFALMAALSYAVMSVLVKIVGQSLPTSLVLFFRFASSLILLLPWLITDSTFTLKMTQPGRYAARILTALVALFLFFYAIKFIPLVDALLLNNTAPLFMPILVLLFTGARTPKKVWWGIMLGYIGIVIVLHPSGEFFKPTSIIALISGILAAFAILQIRLLAKTTPVKQMLFYYFLVSTIVLGFFAGYQWQTPGSIYLWLLLIGIGIFGTLYQVFSTLSYATAPVRLMSPLTFMTVVFGGLFDWFLWGHVPSLTAGVGFTLVIIGSIITIYFGQELVAIKKEVEEKS